MEKCEFFNPQLTFLGYVVFHLRGSMLIKARWTLSRLGLNLKEPWRWDLFMVWLLLQNIYQIF